MNLQSIYSLVVFLVFIALTGFSQPAEELVKIKITPDHKDWQYRAGDKVKFYVKVSKHDTVLDNVDIKFSLGPEMMNIEKSGSMTLAKGEGEIVADGMTVPGFLRCSVSTVFEGKTYRGIGTAGFDPLSIKPYTLMPSDFMSFWTSARDEAASIPMDVKLNFLPDRSSANVNVYEVNIQNYPIGARLYGVLCVPKAEGKKYPALLEVPGAGVRAYKGDIALAEKGVITFQIGIHGIPVTLPGSIYDDLKSGALKNYNTYNLDNKDLYYYKRVYLGCLRAIDYIFTLPQFDGKNLGVSGASQGGALSIVTAALDKRVTCLAATHPALCDLTAILHGRADGWPHMFNNNVITAATPQKLNTVQYYDVVNFARILNKPGFYDWGYNDETCPPSSTYSAYNEIKAPKKLSLYLNTGHWMYPHQREEVNSWLLKQLKVE